MAKRDKDQALLDALRHPLRRDLLRRYMESKKKLSPRELATLENKSLSLVSYHVRELVRLGAVEIADTKQVRGSVQHFYLATARVKRSPLVRAALGMAQGG
ncbi:MAG TPA: helix-turn-helix domain-containing protein [Solirubrobacterales bacterium]|nr:helix-turn-helix domain-containing protein [Solirubrobacterales bacterium]